VHFCWYVTVLKHHCVLFLLHLFLLQLLFFHSLEVAKKKLAQSYFSKKCATVLRAVGRQ